MVQEDELILCETRLQEEEVPISVTPVINNNTARPHSTSASESLPIHITHEGNNTVLVGKTKLDDTTATKTLLQMTINQGMHQNTLYHIFLTHIVGKSNAHIPDKF